MADASNGGSGGGAGSVDAGDDVGTKGTGNAGGYSPVEGYAGGDQWYGSPPPHDFGAGGGGQDRAGQSGLSGGKGAIGLDNSYIDGTTAGVNAVDTFAGGGGGSGYYYGGLGKYGGALGGSESGSLGGQGDYGAGNGSGNAQDAAGGSGTANSGGGGGAQSNGFAHSNYGGSGGSGVVVLRWLTP
jgi:hypothetical protein